MASLEAEFRRAVNPASTGGAGTYFEQHVDAVFMALLLVRAVPPILRDCTVSEVHFQTERLGWCTDDILVVGEKGDGTQRKLLVQSKRTFTVSSSDSECKKAIIDGWKDFRNSAEFSASHDRIAIVTLRGTNTFLGQFVGLLDCARASRDSSDFERRLSTPGLVHQTVLRYRNAIRDILVEHEGAEVSSEDLWAFLKVLHGFSYDLNTSTAQTESLIKTLLAHTSQGGDPVGAAEASWNELLREVGEGMPGGKSYRWDDLPQSCRERHTPVDSHSQQALTLLSNHGGVVLDGIRTTVGTHCHLGRSAVVQQLLAGLQESQVVVVTGPAGSGKSGVAKLAMERLAADNFTFCFRAEEFSVAHLDEVLQRSQVPINAVTLGGLLAGHGQKVLLVESIERLLEASTREAFTDLLTLVRRDPTWRLVLTCRDYSSDLVRSAFLEYAGVVHSVVEVPPLDDSELGEAEAAIPQLSTPLSSPVLQRLLRSPYILDLAARMAWPAGRAVPESERSFRDMFWRHIVKREERASEGMPRRRNDAFVQIALRRARQLSLFAACSDLDSTVIDALRQDSLVTLGDASDALVAPAHDVLEDWAILRWIEEQYATHEESLPALARVLGTEPAIRRSYRKWVIELVERNIESADAIYAAVVAEESLSAHFHDDTLVSLLKSAAAAEFLQRNAASLFGDNRRLLQRVIHLLRVGCVTTPPWFGGTGNVASLMQVPDGEAWECVLRLVASRLGELGAADLQLVLGLAEDAARGVNWKTPYPKGSDSVVKIAYWLLPHFDDYRSEESRKRVLQIIAKLPNSNVERIGALLAGNADHEATGRLTRDLREIVLSGMEGMAVCRDLPEIVIGALRDEMLLTEAALRDHWHHGCSTETEPHFGIRERMGFRHFPASAYHGPFWYLFQHHPARGIEFLLEVFNHSAEWHAARRVPMEYIEEPFEVTLTFADGRNTSQWCSARLWGWYRGTTVGPYVLQSMLMAFELWLLDAGKAWPDDLDELLVNILRRSKSAAVTAVVASVATAYPRVAAETLLVLLRSSEFILLDKQRLVQEGSVGATLGILPSFDSTKKIYEQERKEAAAREHRRHDLETAIANLQLTPHASRVYEMIDQHRENMPPVSEQSEGDRIWRLALHRMDLRQYTVSEQQEEATVNDLEGAPDPSADHRLIRLDLGAADPDVQEMVDASAEKFAVTESRIGLFMWGRKAFAGEETTRYDPAKWRTMLQAAMKPSVSRTDDGVELAMGAPEWVAAVCVRDHFEELTGEEVTWCVETVCAAIHREASNWDRLARVQRGAMEGDRPSAFVLSCLVGKPLDGELQTRVRDTLPTAVTHAIDEVRSYAVAGVGRWLWSSDPSLPLRCVTVLAMEARAIQERWEAQDRRPFEERMEYGQLAYEVGMEARSQFYGNIDDDAYQRLDVSDLTGSAANCHILAILTHAPREQRASDAFQRLARVLVQWWDSADRHRSIDNEVALGRLFEEFVLKIPAKQSVRILEPILETIDRHPRETSSVLQGIIGAEDRLQQTDRFWSVWRMFGQRVRQAKWLANIDNEHALGTDVMAAVFLTQYWKDDVEHWRSLEGHSQYVHELFQDLPPSSSALDNYVRFVYHIGSHSLPRAFQIIAGRLRAGDPAAMLRQGNTVFMLESLLRRYVYGRPRVLKCNGDLREAVLYLLDTLVENGSSSAYRMRDDFVTPAAATA